MSEHDDDTLRWLVRALQGVLVVLVAYGLFTLNIGLLVNAGVSLAVTFLPSVLQREYHLRMDAGLTLWLTLAVFLHALGAVGAYDWFGWYDQLTHTLSASVVAGAGYASARALDIHNDDLYIPQAYMAGFIIVFVLSFGVLWEILEFGLGGLATFLGGDPILAQHGVTNTVTDLVFDTIGGALVALFGATRLRGFASTLAGRIGSIGQ
jgi:hypothetical protein